MLSNIFCSTSSVPFFISSFVLVWDLSFKSCLCASKMFYLKRTNKVTAVYAGNLWYLTVTVPKIHYKMSSNSYFLWLNSYKQLWCLHSWQLCTICWVQCISKYFIIIINNYIYLCFCDPASLRVNQICPCVIRDHENCSPHIFLCLYVETAEGSTFPQNEGIVELMQRRKNKSDLFLSFFVTVMIEVQRHCAVALFLFPAAVWIWMKALE